MKSKNLRIVARLDIKNENVVKGIQLEGQRIVGNPKKLSERYYKEGIDEIFFMTLWLLCMVGDIYLKL